MTAMTDPELLLLAAKAAGAKPYDWNTSRNGLFISNGVPMLLANGDPDGDWNPLADDGQALRLAVQLWLSVIQQHTFKGPEPVSAASGFGADDFRLTSTPYNGNPLAATRRAIVLAAAEIGKALERTPPMPA
jgi:hypothetical protein